MLLGSGSRILRLRRTILLLLEEKSLKAACFESLIVKQGSWTDAQRLFRSFLARNQLVDSPSA
jgi:hypothetical protein